MSDNKFKVTDQHGREHDLSTGEPKYWSTISGHTLELVDYPTDGPQFRNLSEEDEEFEMLQFSTEGFREAVESGEINPVPEHLMERSEDHIAVMYFGAEASDHVLVFEVSEPIEYGDEDPWDTPRVWLVTFQQMGETHKATYEDIPQWVIDRVEDEYGVEVVEG